MKYHLLCSIFREKKTDRLCIICKVNLSYTKKGIFISILENLPPLKEWNEKYHGGDLWFCSPLCAEMFIIQTIKDL